MTEIPWLLRMSMYHFGSGDALFAGLLLLLFAVRAEMWKWRRRWVELLAIAGFVWIGLSAWPSLLMQTAVLTTAALWLCAGRLPRWFTPQRAAAVRIITIALLLIAAGMEWPWHRFTTLNLTATPQIAVIGDSVTAGLEASDQTWPRQAVERFGWTVFDASQQGATVRSAIKQLDTLGSRGDVLIMEIGGIDVLEQTPVPEFARDLDSLLSAARLRYQTVIMTEIPLPPLCNRYGIEQRKVARKYNVVLIPKREMISVLASNGGTVDGVHLSNAGQSRLADVMHRAIGGNAQIGNAGVYQRCEPEKQASPVAIQR